MRVDWGENNTIPRVRLGILLDHMIVIIKEYPNGVFTRQNFVDVLGLSPKSGGPEHKFASLRQFKLVIKSDIGEYTVTNLAKTIVNETGTIRSDAINKAVRNIRLWDQLLNKINTEFTDESFVSAFKEITGVQESEIISELKQLRYAYSEDVGCIKRMPPFSTWSAKIGKPRQSQLSTINTQPFISPPKKYRVTDVPRSMLVKLKDKLTIEYGSLKFEVKDKSSIELAKLLVNIKENGLLRGGDYEQK